MRTALCKLRGMLVVMKIEPLKEGKTARCPDCGGTEFYRDHGWLQCTGRGDGCGFAALEAHVQREGRL